MSDNINPITGYSNHDPWVMQEAKTFKPLPLGGYNTLYRGVEDKQVQPQKGGDSGKRWLWKWEVATGEYQGKIATSLTEQNINPNSLAGKIIVGLLGRMPVPGELLKQAVEACIGKRYMVLVEAGPKGGKPQVRTCFSPPPDM